MKTFREIVEFFRQKDRLDKEVLRMAVEAQTEANSMQKLQDELEQEKGSRTKPDGKAEKRGAKPAMRGKHFPHKNSNSEGGTAVAKL